MHGANMRIISAAYLAFKMTSTGEIKFLSVVYKTKEDKGNV